MSTASVCDNGGEKNLCLILLDSHFTFLFQGVWWENIKNTSKKKKNPPNQPRCFLFAHKVIIWKSIYRSNFYPELKNGK